MDGQYFFFVQLSLIPITFIIGRQLKGLLSNILQNDNKTKAHISHVYFPGSQNLVGFNVILLRVRIQLFSHVQLFATPWIVCSLQGSSVHRISQARILEWVAISSSRGSLHRDRICISCIIGRSFTTQPLGKPTAQSYDNLILSNDSSLQALGSGAMTGYYNSWVSFSYILNYKDMPSPTICVSIGSFIDHYKEALDEFRNRKIGCIYSNIQNDNKTSAK